MKKICDNSLYRADLRKALAYNDLTALTGKSIMITGASGLIGTAIVDMLLECNRAYHTDIRIIAAVYDYEETLARFDRDPNLTCVYYNALKPVEFDFNVDMIIHAASNASPDAYINAPVDTMMANVMGVYELLGYARRCGATKLLYISSSEVYGKKEHSNPFSEDEYGFVDILQLRSSYPMGKRAAETLCVCYSKQYNINVSIVRPGHIYGPTASPHDQRVSSLFAYLAARGQDLVLKSSGEQIRSYCYVMDCASAILTVLLRGNNAEAYNISNRKSIISIREMAALYAESGNVKLFAAPANEVDQASFNPMNNSSLDSKKLEALGWNGVFEAREGIGHTVSIIKNMLQ